MERYIGLDAHSQSCTLAVMTPTGRRSKELVVETNAPVLREAIRAIAGSKHLCMEEGELSQWLFETLEPLVDELVVIQPPIRQGDKSDAIDAWELADRIRTGRCPKRVFKVAKQLASLREAVRAHSTLTRDLVRCKNRLRGVFRSRAVRELDATLYDPSSRGAWAKKLPATHRRRADELGKELDAITEVHERVESWLHDEAARNRDVQRLTTLPGVGPVRAAQIVATVVSPARFRTKRQFWSYCGLGIVRRSSSDWVKDKTRGWERKQVAQTRGLNQNRNPLLKEAFTAAALTVIEQMPKHPLNRDYRRLLDAGTKPNLARLTIARRIAAAALAIWKHKEDYDPSKHRSQDAA
jgi:transposase